MFLYRRGKTWWLKYRAGGCEYRQSCHTQKRSQAERYLDAIRAARRMPTFEEGVEVLRRLYGEAAPHRITLDNAWQTYWDMARDLGRDAIGETTRRQREGELKQLIAWLRAHAGHVTAIEQITGVLAGQYAAHLARTGIKTKTRINRLGALSTIWSVLEKFSDSIHNPWHGLLPTDTDGVRGKSFSPDEEQRILEAARRVGRDWWSVCTIMRHTGLRYGDVARLRWDEIDGDAIRLAPHKTRRHGIEVVLPITASVREALDAVPRRGDYIFPLHADLYGQRGRAARDILAFRDVLAAAGLDGRGYTIHSWRHTAATRLAEAGVGVETRMRLLGHTAKATAERYDHAEHLGELRAAMEAAAGTAKNPGED